MQSTLLEKQLDGIYYIKLSVDTDDEDFLTTFSPQTISIIESLTANTPYMNVKFTDGIGELVSINPIIPDANFYVSFGRKKEGSTESRFKLSTINYGVNNKDGAENVHVTSDMISDKWESIFKKVHNRAWIETSYSDVIEQVFSEAGFVTDIEKTSGLHTVYQPNWTNSQLLNWIAKRAVNQNGVGGYAFFFRTDGVFVFKTYDTLYDSAPARTLVHSSTEVDADGFNFMTIKNKYMPALIKGGFGTSYNYFDYRTKKFVSGDSLVTNINERQLSDWYYVAESHNEPSTFMYGGRDIDTKNVAEAQVLNSANSVQRLDLYIKGDTSLHCGDIVNLHIPTSKFLRNDAPINGMYSGYWMIYKVAHLFNIAGNSYFTQLFLTRNGIDGKTVNGFIQTNTGKKLR